MKYEKPEVSSVNATEAIRGQQAGSKVGTVGDNLTPVIPSDHATAAAYEADE